MYFLKPNCFLLLLCLIFSAIGNAQDKEATYVYHNFTVNKTYSLYGDKVKLRAEPNTTSEVVSLLRIGDEVKILKKTDLFLEDASHKTAWYEVQYNEKKGFIAGKFIANAHTKNREQHFYFRKYLNDEQGVLYTRTVHNSKIKTYSESTLKLLNENIGITFDKNHDLKDILQIVEVNYYGDSCGAESGKTVLFLRNDYTLNKIADLSLIGDGGIYSLTETFEYKFSEDNGQPIILFTKEEMELVDEDKNWLESKKMTRIYEWDGKKLVPEFSKKFHKQETSN